MTTDSNNSKVIGSAPISNLCLTGSVEIYADVAPGYHPKFIAQNEAPIIMGSLLAAPVPCTHVSSRRFVLTGGLDFNSANFSTDLGHIRHRSKVTQERLLNQAAHTIYENSLRLSQTLRTWLHSLAPLSTCEPGTHCLVISTIQGAVVSTDAKTGTTVGHPFAHFGSAWHDHLWCSFEMDSPIAPLSDTPLNEFSWDAFRVHLRSSYFQAASEAIMNWDVNELDSISNLNPVHRTRHGLPLN